MTSGHLIAGQPPELRAEGVPVMSPAGVGVVAVRPDRDEREALVDLVGEFARAEIGPLVERPESPAGPDAVDDTLTRLTALGVLTDDGDPGLGLWDLPAEPDACRLSLDLIGQVGEVSPGIGYALHLRGLAGWLDRAAQVFGPAGLVSFDRSGTGGAGRAVGHALAGGPLSSDDAALLETNWGTMTSDHPLLVVGTGSWHHLWWPQWSADGGWRLYRTPRSALSCTRLEHAHGLDELAYESCHRAGGAGPDAVLESAHVVDGLALHGLGLLALAAAAARRAVTRARGYSRTRRQGGQFIGTYDAVAQLLSHSEQTLATSRAVLDHLAVLPAGPARLHQVWRARAQLHPLLTAAGSDALQVFGGAGYLRDVGAEKDLRDLNTLRRLGGSPMELTLRCAAFDESAGAVA